MPDKPLWLDHLSWTIQQLAQKPAPWVNRPAAEKILTELVGSLVQDFIPSPKQRWQVQ